MCIDSFNLESSPGRELLLLFPFYLHKTEVTGD